MRKLVIILSLAIVLLGIPLTSVHGNSFVNRIYTNEKPQPSVFMRSPGFRDPGTTLIQSSFETSLLYGSGGYALPPGDYCNNTQHLILKHGFIWKASNIKSVSVIGAEIDLSEPGTSMPKDQTGEQSGTVYILDDLGPSNSTYDNKSMTFTWQVVYQDGTIHSFTPLPDQSSIPGWSCH